MDLPIKISDRCCQAMKKGPMHIYERATKRYPITGTTAAESLIRTQSWIGRGCNSYSIQKGRAAKSNPLAPWLEQDILHYIKRNDIEICSVYGDLVYTDADGNELDTALDADQPLKCTGLSANGLYVLPVRRSSGKRADALSANENHAPAAIRIYAWRRRMDDRGGAPDMASQQARPRVCSSFQHDKRHLR